MDEVLKQNLEEAAERLDAARLLLQNEKYEDAVSRAYYSMFHSTKALLQTRDISPRTHRGLIGKFGKEFVKTKDVPQEYSAMLSNAETLRENADYGIASEIGLEDAETVVEDAEKFHEMARELLTDSSPD